MSAIDNTRRRLGRTLLAQFYSQIVTVGCQLALVPLLLWVWGAERYGAWLVLTAVPTFLTFSDFGFTFIAKNEMTISVAAGNKARALRTFQSIFMLLLAIVPVVCVATATIISNIDIGSSLSIYNIDAWQLQASLFLLVSNVLLYQFFLLVCAGIRAENRPATESLWAATSRLSESVAYGLTACFTRDFAIIAAMGLLSRIAFLLAAYIYLKRLSPWLSFGWSAATRDEITRLAHPALAYMLVPLAQAMLIQGPVVLVGKLLNPTAVVTFATTRTLVRVGTSVTNMFNNTFIAEYSAMAGRGDRERFTRLYRGQIKICVLLIVAYVAFLVPLAPYIMSVFTHGKVTIIFPFFYIILGAVALEMLWSAQFTPISAVNLHKPVTYALAALSILGISGIYAVIPSYGITGAALVLLLVQLAMVVVCVGLNIRLSKRETLIYAESA